MDLLADSRFCLYIRADSYRTYVQFWLPSVPLWLIEIVALVLLFGLNTLNARFFGETEFWFAIIKVVAIVGMIGTAIFLLFGHYEYSSVIQGQTYEGSVSLSNITNNFSFFPKGVMNWVSALQMVMFAFTSMEFIGMTAAETENPRKTIPKAINQIAICYGLSTYRHQMGCCLNQFCSLDFCWFCLEQLSLFSNKKYVFTGQTT